MMIDEQKSDLFRKFENSTKGHHEIFIKSRGKNGLRNEIIEIIYEPEHLEGNLKVTITYVENVGFDVGVNNHISFDDRIYFFNFMRRLEGILERIVR